MNNKCFSLIEILIAGSLLPLLLIMLLSTNTHTSHEYIKDSKDIMSQDEEQKIILFLKPYTDTLSGFIWDDKNKKAFINSLIGTAELSIISKNLVLRSKNTETILTKRPIKSFKMIYNGNILRLQLFGTDMQLYFFSVW